MTKVVAPTIANLISSWCRSKYGRIGAGQPRDRGIGEGHDKRSLRKQCTADAHPCRSRPRDAMTPWTRVPTPEHAPVVTMIGGGQLARMTHQAAIALGQTLRVLAVTARRPRRAGHPGRGDRRRTPTSTRCAARPTGADALTFDHEHVPTELLEKLVAEGVNVAPPPEALIHAQDKLVMRRRLEAIGRPGAALRRGDRRRLSWTRSRARRRPVVVKTVRGGYDGRGVLLARDLDEARDFAGAQPRRGHPGPGRGARGDAARAGRAGGPVAVRPGRGVAGGGDRAAGRHLRGGDRARARAGPTKSPARAGQLALRLAAELGVVGRAGGRAVRDRRRRTAWSTSWRCARTTPGTGRWTARAPVSSSSTCARCWTIRSATPA